MAKDKRMQAVVLAELGKQTQLFNAAVQSCVEEGLSVKLNLSTKSIDNNRDIGPFTFPVVSAEILRRT